MSNVFAINSVGESLRTYLENAYPAALRAQVPCDFRLLSSGQLTDTSGLSNVLSLYLYRVTINEHLRNQPKRVDVDQENTPLSLDLHYLLSVWSSSAFNEQTILAWTMRELHQHPVLDRSSLSDDAEWGNGDFVQIIPAELSTEDIMRVWDALEPAYRLSVSYTARVVRIDADPVPAGRPVVASRFAFTDEVPVLPGIPE